MKLQPRYCRTCGTRILVKNVCHNCGSDPLTGDNYCYDCGALTPESTKCLNCGASFQKKISSSTAIILGSILILIMAVAAYIVSQSDKQPSKPAIAKSDKPNTAASDETKQEIENRPTIVSNTTPPQDLSKKQDSTNIAAAGAVVNDTAAKKNTAASQKITVNLFSPSEVKEHNGGCTYFENKQKSEVLFFTAGGSGYIKINDTVYPLKRIKKTSDVSKFGGGLYEVIVEIKGLSGSDKEWLASGILTVKDLVQKTTEKRKIYSSCINL